MDYQTVTFRQGVMNMSENIWQAEDMRAWILVETRYGQGSLSQNTSIQASSVKHFYG